MTHTSLYSRLTDASVAASSWIDDRTGIISALRHFLDEDIPGSSGWHQVLGSVAVFSFLVQVVTGILLAFNYAPTPGEAYSSVRYIATEITGGSIIRGVHHWGASVMIIVVVLHMIQVFLYGAYKKPREVTWMAGVALLLLTLAYGLTGYLLPWDNRAYWGTVVTTQIAAQAPLAGPYLTKLIGGSGSIGVVTFARFYSLHTLVLPPLTMLLIAFHVFLVRKHGVAPAPVETLPKKKFFPGQVFKDTFAIFIAFSIVLAMAVFARIPLEGIADPTDTSYIPRPEWYFLFLFQTLKVFEGPLEVVGSVVLPNLAIVALLLVPFIDRGKALRVAKRFVAIGVTAFGLLGWAGLTATAIATTPKAVESASGWNRSGPEELAGIAYFRNHKCESCHTAGKSGGSDLTVMRSQRAATWIVDHANKYEPASAAERGQLKALATSLREMDEKRAVAFASAPSYAVEGALLYSRNQCAVCHQINGTGMKTGPALNGVGSRRTKQWMEQHFRDPQAASPGTVMPRYAFDAAAMDNLCRFLLHLPNSNVAESGS
jgi:ubiquinol-cytochrome c reductase cytochrome b subunit